MGIFSKSKDRTGKPVKPQVIARYGLEFFLHDDGTIQRVTGEGRGTYPVAGATAGVESGEALTRRVTATRLVGMGVFALAAKKAQGGESYLTIEGEGFAWVEEVPAKKRGQAVEFAAKVRQAAG